MPHFCLYLVLLSSFMAVAGDAVMFRGNPQHTGVFDSSPKKAVGEIKWKFHTKGMVIASPAVVGGTVFVGSTDHNLYAISAADGAVKWKFKTDSRVTSSPAVADGAVYFESYDGYLYAIDTANGQLKWKFKTRGEHRFSAPHLHGTNPTAEIMPDPFDFYLSSPLVWQGIVYFGSGDGNVYALDGASGNLR
jgi:outer membrane protein assembly factor BamB